jgi:hypothetical protein
MDYFKKVGRPTDEEQAMINVIEQLIKDKQISHSEIPHCQTLDDLLEVQNLLEAYVSKEGALAETIETKEDVSTSPINKVTENQIIDKDEIIESNESQLSEQADEDNQTVQIQDGLNQKDEIVENEILVSEIAKEIATESTTIKQDQPNFVANNYDPFSEEIKERSYTNGLNTEQSNKPDSENTKENQNTEQDLNLEESDETPVDNLNLNTKRKIAEQTANSILKGYAKLAPQPFKWLAKINESEIEKLSFDGEININLEVSEGTTFDDYMKQTNEQVDEIFEVDKDTLDEIREPLIEVLLEQKMELTPQQRLMMAVVSHLFQMFTVALNLRRQNNRILDYQKRMTTMMAQKVA